MKPSDIRRISDRLTKLGFKVTITPGPVDRASRPMTFDLQAQSRDLSTEERVAFVKFFAEQK